MLTVADTAFPIATVRAEEGSRPEGERLFDDPYASLFAAAGAHAREGTQRFLDLPFLRDGIRLRTRFIDDAVRDGLAAGLAQVVVLGAGFDARGLRMPEIAARGATVYEVDVAALLDAKRALLDAGGVALPPGLAYVACDLEATDLDAALGAGLAKAGFRRGEAAVFVCEGVLEYLSAAAIDRSLAFMAREGGPGSRLVFTLGHPDVDQRGMPQRALQAGFSACEEHGFDALWRRYLPGEPHEHAWAARIGVARR